MQFQMRASAARCSKNSLGSCKHLFLHQSLQAAATTTVPLLPVFGVLGFLKIEIERELQRNFQTDFIRHMLEQQGAAQRKERSSAPTQGWLCLAAFIRGKESGPGRKGGLVEFSMSRSGDLFF